MNDKIKKFLSSAVTIALLLSGNSVLFSANAEGNETVTEVLSSETFEGNNYWNVHDEIYDNLSSSAITYALRYDNNNLGFTGELYYEQLDDTSKEIYDALYNEYKKGGHGDKITISCNTSATYSSEEELADALSADIRPAVYALMADHPELTWLSFISYKYSYYYNEKSDGTYSITSITFSLASGYNYGTPEKISSAISTAKEKIGEQSDNYEQIKAIHDYLCKNVNYNTTAASSSIPNGYDIGWYQTAYSAFYPITSNNDLDSKAGTDDIITVCAGYSNAFKLLCDQYDIPCVIVSGNGITSKSSGAHMWNYVKLDGNWYAVDVTWDDQTTIYYDYFLVGSETVAEHFSNGAYTFGGSHEEEPFNETELIYPVISETKYVSVMRGDVDGDEDVDATDAKLILNYVLETGTLDDKYLTAADANIDDEINILDAQYALIKSTASADENTKVVLAPTSSETSANAGDTVTITIAVTSDASLGSVQFDLNYDKDCFEVDSVSVNAPSGWISNSNNSDGTIKFGAIGSEGFTTSETFATVTFKVLKVNGKITINNAVVGNASAANMTNITAGDPVTIACAHGTTTTTTTTAATCTDEGKEEKVCDACGETVSTTTIAALGHKYGELIAATAATCEGTGVKAHYKCERCGALLDESKNKVSEEDLVIAAIDHTWDEGKITTEPACTTEGVKTYTCTVCGTTKTETIEATGHTAASEWSCNVNGHWHKCTVCGEAANEVQAHTTELQNAKEATATEDGYTGDEVCTVCGYVVKKGSVIEKKGDGSESSETTTTPAPDSEEPTTTTTTTPAPDSEEPTTTTTAPESEEPTTTTTPTPDSEEPTTTTTAPDSEEPTTTTPAPESEEPITTPSSESEEPTTTTPTPDSEEPTTPPSSESSETTAAPIGTSASVTSSESNKPDVTSSGYEKVIAETPVPVDPDEINDIIDKAQAAVNKISDNVKIIFNSLVHAFYVNERGEHIQPKGYVDVVVEYDGKSNAAIYVGDDKVEFFALTISADRKTATFRTNHFSDYYLVSIPDDTLAQLVQVSEPDDDAIDPSGDDNLATSVTLTIIPTALAAAGALISKKRRK